MWVGEANAFFKHPQAELPLLPLFHAFCVSVSPSLLYRLVILTSFRIDVTSCRSQSQTLHRNISPKAWEG